MARPTVVVESPLLRACVAVVGFYEKHRVTLKLELDREVTHPGRPQPDLLCVAEKSSENADDFYLVEVTGHPDGKRIFAAPNFNPDRDRSAEPPLEIEPIPGKPGHYKVSDTGMRPANFYGKYFDSVDDALGDIVVWVQDETQIPKDYLQPINP